MFLIKYLYVGGGWQVDRPAPEVPKPAVSMHGQTEGSDEDMQIYWDTRAQQFMRISGNGEQESAVRSTPDWATGFMEAEFESGGVKQTTMSYIEWQSAMSGKGAPSGVSKNALHPSWCVRNPQPQGPNPTWTVNVCIPGGIMGRSRSFYLIRK